MLSQTHRLESVNRTRIAIGRRVDMKIDHAIELHVHRERAKETRAEHQK